MWWSIFWIILGFACLVLAGYLVTLVKEVKLGPNASRFVVILLAFIAYYGGVSFSNTVTLLSDIGNFIYDIATLNLIKYSFLTYAIPVLGVVALIYCLWLIYENWETELKAILDSGKFIVVIAICALFARYCFSA